MPSNLKTAKHALQNAVEELRQGKKQAARSWAQCAVELAPGLEEAWLILASVAEPHASLAYIKEALKINPDSQGARQGLFEVQQRLERTSQAGGPKGPEEPEGSEAPEGTEGPEEADGPEEPEVPEGSDRPGEPQVAGSRSGKIKSRFLLNWFRLLPIYGLAIFTVVVLVLLLFQSGIADARGYASSDRKSMILQPTGTSTPDKTLQATERQPGRPFFNITVATKPAETPDPTARSEPNRPPVTTSNGAPMALNASSLSAAVPASGEKRILIRISEQALYAYQGDTLVHRFIVSTGTEGATQVGSFAILDKIPDAYSDSLGFRMPDWLGIYWVGYLEIGIHALPVMPNGEVLWGADLGKPGAHACVVLNTLDAQTLFFWADIGTRVEIVP